VRIQLAALAPTGPLETKTQLRSSTHQTASYRDLKIGNAGFEAAPWTVVVQILSQATKAHVGTPLDFVEIGRNFLERLLKAS